MVEWLRIGGILIRTSPPVSGPSPTPQPPPRSDPTASLAEAQAKVSFPIGVPDALGAPDRIAVSADRQVVSMDWGSGPTSFTWTNSMENFPGSSSRGPGSRSRSPRSGRDAVWFASAHEISYVDREGRERTEQARIAGPSLIWERPVAGRRVTMRLEGDQPRDRAITVAESIR